MLTVKVNMHQSSRGIARANARLKAAGLDVSEWRDGRRPGSQVFTVKSHTEGVPTLVIGGIGRW